MLQFAEDFPFISLQLYRLLLEESSKMKVKKVSQAFYSGVCLLHGCLIFPELLHCCAAALPIYPQDQTETLVGVIKV